METLLINFGEFNQEEYNTLEMVIFFAAASVNLIFMLNMLIAIMSGTFNNVTGNLEIPNYIELTHMILEVELAISTKKTAQNGFRYFQLCEEESSLQKRKDIMTQDIKIIKKAILTMSEKQSLRN